MALMVVLQHLQLHLPLPHPLAFFLLLFGLFSFQVCRHGGLTLGLLLFPFLLFLGLVCPAVVSFTPSITAGGAGPLLFNWWFSGLIWLEDFLGRHLLTLFGGILLGAILFGSILLGGILFGSILLGSVLPRGTLGWCALRRCISGSTLLTLLELCQ